MAIVNRIQIQNNIFYEQHPDHRNRTRGKSQWTIKLNEEVTSFSNTLNQNWIVNNTGWGLHLINSTPQYLGIDMQHQNNLFIAKFVNSKNCWHGYPVDHQRGIFDVPDETILNTWLNSSIIPAAKIRKILKGQPCNL